VLAYCCTCLRASLFPLSFQLSTTAAFVLPVRLFCRPTLQVVMSPGKKVMRVNARLIFHRCSAIKRFKMPVGCSFQKTLLYGTLPISLRPTSNRIGGGANSLGYTLTVDGLQFSSTLFPGVSPCSPLLSVKHSATWIARSATYITFKMVRCKVYVLYWCAFPHPLSFSLAYCKGWDAFLCTQHEVWCSAFSCT